MQKFDLDNSPLLESFKNLQYREIIYSRKFGLGQVRGFYNEEIIVQFSNLIKRFSIDDNEIRRVPEEYLVRKDNKIKIVYDGEEMSYGKYKKKAGFTKKQIKEEKLKYLTIKEVLDILGITKSKLIKSISENNIQTKSFGRSVMIHRDDFLRLYEKSNKDK